MNDHVTYLTAGQRYAHPDVPCWRTDRQVIILAVDLDGKGRPHILYRRPDGRDIRGDAALFEAAIAAGSIVPVSATGQRFHC